MTHSQKSLVLTAAFAGLAVGTAARAATPLPPGAHPLFASGSQAGIIPAQKKEIEKHACRGLNSCKGNGGGSKKEWGKNSCKGKGGCATDGSKHIMDSKKS
jgi:hypothetical protein